MAHRSDQHHFERLRIAADAEVHAVLRALPRNVRELAHALPVTYEPVPSPDLVKDGLEPDILGLFVGTPYPEEMVDTDPLPAQIILFLENIWEFADGDAPLFREEVRKTYLHELGHYLGLDEDDLVERDLD